MRGFQSKDMQEILKVARCAGDNGTKYRVLKTALVNLQILASDHKVLLTKEESLALKDLLELME
jgi:hypothetical protein